MKNDLTMFGYVLRLAAVLVAVTFLVGCGKSNDTGLQLSAVNKHPADWVTAHRSAYMKTPDVCRSCHGVDLKGGVTKIDCFNQAGLGQCHAGTPPHGPRSVAHSLPFKDSALHGAEAIKDLIICQDCHGTAGGAGSNPRFNLAIGSLTAGCETCHLTHATNMAHPKPWSGLKHKGAGNMANACALCHGATLAGGSGPACNECHKQLIAGTVPVAGQCVSCHNNPPNGTAAPNRAGSHTVHLALGGMSGNCAACHAGGGTGTPDHGSKLTFTFASNFNATSGTALYAAATGCANVSCHGGQQTPIWGSNLDVLANCTSCHKEGTAEYTSYNSGRHSYHLSRGFVCRDCHDMVSPAKHFKDVTTKEFETLPSLTLHSFMTYSQSSCMFVGSAPSVGVQSTKCHDPGVVKSWK
jgi:predicted CxxxxCH...CXXCH cytochrome family protein